MKGTKGLFRLGMLALALSFMAVLAGCDNPAGGDNEGGSNITLSVRNNGWSRPITRVVVKPLGAAYSREDLFDTGHMSLNITNGKTETFSVNLKGNSRITIEVYYYAYTTGNLIGLESKDVENTAPGKKYLATLSSGRYMTVTEE